MIRRAAFALSFALATAAGAQRPDLSGTWVRADSVERAAVAATGDAAFRRGEMGVGWGTPLTITQQGDRLTVEYAFFIAYDLQPKTRLTYLLDGVASSNTLMVGHTETTVRSTARFDGATLTIVTDYPGPPGPEARALATQVRQVIRIESPTRMVVETTRPGVAGGTPATSRAIYNKR